MYPTTTINIHEFSCNVRGARSFHNWGPITNYVGHICMVNFYGVTVKLGGRAPLVPSSMDMTIHKY